ncbi:pilus assembly protein TadG-related protein [Chloroflexota bacterium]
MKSRQNNENGQAIVLIALAFIVMVGFAALAIDGGMFYSDRRHAQNAADAGALAGAGDAALILENAHLFNQNFECNLSVVTNAMAVAESTALDWMSYNGYADPGTDEPAEAVCTSITTNDDGSPLFFPKKYIELTTDIITDTQTALIHVVYDGPAQNRVKATTKIEPPIPYAYGQAVVGLNPETDCNNASVAGVKFGGTGDARITGGGVWSEGCLTGNGSCIVEVIDPDTTDDKYVGIGYHGGSFGSCPTMTPAPVPSNESLPKESYYVPAPSCRDELGNVKTGAVEMDDIQLSGNQVVNLNDLGVDLICLTSTGNAIKMTGGELIGDEGITIYLENSGDIEISGGIANLMAPGAYEDPGLAGVLFYVDDTDESVIDITGNVTSTYMGMIYAPKADIKITGTGDIGPTLNTQIIGWNVTLLGTANVTINFNNTWNSIKPSTLNLEK